MSYTSPFGPPPEFVIKNLRRELSYYRDQHEVAKQVIEQLAGNGPADVLFMHPMDISQLFDRVDNRIIDVWKISSKPTEYGLNEFQIAASRIRIKQTMLMPQGVGLKELDRREAEIKSRFAAKLALVSALPTLARILSNSEFIRGVEAAGLKIDVDAIRRVVSDITDAAPKSYLNFGTEIVKKLTSD